MNLNYPHLKWSSNAKLDKGLYIKVKVNFDPIGRCHLTYSITRIWNVNFYDPIISPNLKREAIAYREASSPRSCTFRLNSKGN